MSFLRLAKYAVAAPITKGEPTNRPNPLDAENERGATALGGIGLVVAALEGILCILLASPLGLGVALHAPHVVGYFRTSSTSFELLRRPNDHTEIIERTSHELKLDPILYWLPMARWVVDQNNARVLAHIQRQAERSFGAGG